eukprot:UN00585
MMAHHMMWKLQKNGLKYNLLHKLHNVILGINGANSGSAGGNGGGSSIDDGDATDGQDGDKKSTDGSSGVNLSVFYVNALDIEQVKAAVNSIVNKNSGASSQQSLQ